MLRARSGLLAGINIRSRAIAFNCELGELSAQLVGALRCCRHPAKIELRRCSASKRVTHGACHRASSPAEAQFKRCTYQLLLASRHTNPDQLYALDAYRCRVSLHSNHMYHAVITHPHGLAVHIGRGKPRTMVLAYSTPRIESARWQTLVGTRFTTKAVLACEQGT